METIRIVLDLALLRATDAAAKRARVDRSALVRDALREHLKHLETKELEARDGKGHLEHPCDSAEITDWERVAVWPAR
jgi:metal-responsive CopG/Arc/MetJ family transcriptional regulator